MIKEIILVEITFLYMGVCIKLYSKDPFYIEYCKKYFEGYIDCVQYPFDVAMIIELKGKGEEYDKSNYVNVTSDASPFLILYNEYEKKLIVSNVAEEFSKDIMRLVREIILFCSTSYNNCSFLHSACVTDDKKAVAIMGNKFAGKTTLCLQLLSKGWNYISNDKLILQKVEESIFCWGLPIAMGIREGTKVFFPNSLKGLKRDETDNRYYLYPHEIAKRCNVKIVNATILSLIVFPVYQSSADEVIITKVNQEELRHLVYEQYLETLYADQKKLNGFEPRSDFSVLESVCKIPAYKITTNARLSDQISNAIKKLLAELCN